MLPWRQHQRRQTQSVWFSESERWLAPTRPFPGPPSPLPPSTSSGACGSQTVPVRSTEATFPQQKYCDVDLSVFTSAPSKGESFRLSKSSLFLKTAHIMGVIQAKMVKDRNPALSTGWDLSQERTGHQSCSEEDNQVVGKQCVDGGEDTHCGEEKRMGFNVWRLWWYFLWGGSFLSPLSRSGCGAADSTDWLLHRKLVFWRVFSTETVKQTSKQHSDKRKSSTFLAHFGFIVFILYVFYWPF